MNGQIVVDEKFLFILATVIGALVWAMKAFAGNNKRDNKKSDQRFDHIWEDWSELAKEDRKKNTELLGKIIQLTETVTATVSNSTQELKNLRKGIEVHSEKITGLNDTIEEFNRTVSDLCANSEECSGDRGYCKEKLKTITDLLTLGKGVPRVTKDGLE